MFDGKPTRDSVEAWFSANDNQISPLRVIIDGSLLGTDFLREKFHSELAIANLLKNIMKGTLQAPGILVEELHPTTNLPIAYLEMVKQVKEQESRKIVLLHETGTPMLIQAGTSVISKNLFIDNDIAVLIGNHLGFPNEIEKELLQASDHVLCLSTKTPSEGSPAISYLGSHVIDMLHYFLA